MYSEGMKTTNEIAVAALEIFLAISEAVRELCTVPSGHLYAQVLQVLSLEQYEQVLGTLERAGVIKIENLVVRWTGR